MYLQFQNFKQKMVRNLHQKLQNCFLPRLTSTYTDLQNQPSVDYTLFEY